MGLAVDGVRCPGRRFAAGEPLWVSRPTPTPSLPGRGANRALLLIPLLLSACNAKLPDKAADAKAEAHEQAIAKAEGKIECASPASNDFAVECGIDRVETQDGLYLTLRHPDGGFRRLLVTDDGRGVIAADGAQEAIVTPLGPDKIEVALGGARYRLPATVRTPAAKLQ